MRPLTVLPATLAPFAPLTARPARAVGEAVVGGALLEGLAALADPRHEHTVVALFLIFLADVWLTCWPAVRLRPLQGGAWPRRLLLGAGRTLLLGVLRGPRRHDQLHRGVTYRLLGQPESP